VFGQSRLILILDCLYTYKEYIGITFVTLHYYHAVLLSLHIYNPPSCNTMFKSKLTSGHTAPTSDVAPSTRAIPAPLNPIHPPAPSHHAPHPHLIRHHHHHPPPPNTNLSPQCVLAGPHHQSTAHPPTAHTMSTLRAIPRLTALRAPAQRSAFFSTTHAPRSGGHESQYDPPTGWLFGVKPGEKYEKEGWEGPIYWGLCGSMALGVVAYAFKPDTRYVG
jgi:hypothetical protein